MDRTGSLQTWIDGRAATTEELAPLAFAGFAHFTAMQVRGGRVRGLDLHLARLRAASIALFGAALPDDKVRAALRSAIGSLPADMSLTATMYSRNGEFTPSGRHDDPALLVRTGAPSNGPDGPLTLDAVRHERALPDIKHVGEVAKTHHLRRAVAAGYDDALFVDPQGRISEATIWNIAFWDGEAVVWPQAPHLPGVTMTILKRRLTALGIPQREDAVGLDDVRHYRGAAVMNSWTPGVPVAGVAAVPIPMSERFMTLLHNAYANEPAARV